MLVIHYYWILSWTSHSQLLGTGKGIVRASPFLGKGNFSSHWENKFSTEVGKVDFWFVFILPYTPHPYPPYNSEVWVYGFHFIFRCVYCSWIQHIFLWCHANIIWMESAITLMKTASILLKDVLLYFQSLVWIFIGAIVLSFFLM